MRAKGPRGGEVGGVPPRERSRGFSLPGWPRFHLFSESLDRGPPSWRLHLQPQDRSHPRPEAPSS